MINVLILEDSPEQRQALEEYLKMVFEGVRVRTVGNVQSARQLILEGNDSQEPFDIVIADVKVPEAPGKQAEAYPEWAEALDYLDRSRTLIIPISAYLSDSKITDLTFSASKASPAIRKGPESSQKVVTRIAEWLIDRELDSIFGSRVQERALGLTRPRTGAVTSLAHLTDRIQQLWRRLGPGVRSRIRERFEVIERPDDPNEVESISLEKLA